MSSPRVRGFLFLTVAVFGAAIAAERLPPSANVGVFEQLKPGAGRELVLANCMPCHSTAVIASSHQSRERWDQTITKMQKQNGLWPLAPDTRRQILDYLAATQPPSDPGLEKGKESPWAAPAYRPNPIW
jgi:hypothetical protein